MDSIKIPGNDFLDILFDGRNKDYGAYELRNRYDVRVRNAIMGTTSILLMIIGGYVLNNKLMAAENVIRPFIAEKITELMTVKLPEENRVIPPPAVHTPPPAATSVRLAKMVVTPDKEVRPEDEPPKLSDIGNKAIGLENKVGNPDGLADGLPEFGKPGGSVVEAPLAPDREGPLTFVDIKPEFPGGQAALMKYLQKNMRYPSLAQSNEIQGTVYIQFVVNRDGSITDVKTRGAVKGGGLEEEAMRVVRNMPKWKPGKQSGQQVAVFFNLPVNFILAQ
ncbi:energy transducer TonB [Chitinophaga sp. MM2321]|uniref:energy transducer TonB n=1 Tax=Chitinophaga sp. MM2321 TaxID=3137178 RepID=UPI0032D57D86